MEYFGSISIADYKGIRQLDIDCFSSVNLITGPNGSGKTTLLKALDILTNPGDFSHYVKVCGNTFSDFVNSFDKRELNPHTKLSGILLGNPYLVEIVSHLPITNKEFSGYLHFCYPCEGEYKIKTKEITHSLEETAVSYSKPLVRYRYVSSKNDEVCLKRIVDDNTVKESVLSFLSLYDEEMIAFHTEDFKEYFLYHNTYGNLPPDFFSDGIRYFLKIAETFSNFSDGIIAIDGLEQQFAKNTVTEVINFIYRLAKERQIQVFLTTQSAEIIDECLDLMKFHNDLEKLTIIRLRSDKESTTCLTFPGERAYQLRLEREIDFRDEPHNEGD